MKTTKEKAEIMLAFDRGERVEWIRNIPHDVVWTPLPPNKEPVWAWDDNDYRIEEKPKEKVKMLCYTQNSGLIWCKETGTQVGGNWKRFPAGDIEDEVGE